MILLRCVPKNQRIPSNSRQTIVSFLNTIMCTGVTFQMTRMHMLRHILCAKARLIHLVFWLLTHVYLAYDDCRVYVFYVNRCLLHVVFCQMLRLPGTNTNM